MSLDEQFAVARTIAVVAGVMSPGQRQTAADQLRALPGTNVQRKLYSETALALHAIAEQDRP